MFSSFAYAKCEGGSKTLFSCSAKSGKQIEVCDAGSTISYSFGKPQSKPDIALAVPRKFASTSQYQGIGRDMTYSVDIPNGNTTYSVFFSSDKLGDHNIESGVNVSIDNKPVATVNCSGGKDIVNNLEGVDLKPSE
ncbi:hypothetical protein SAMN04515618_114134 [Collimonas sp. OK307]|nr:hypothetical protein SAMN04515618_114134 [Collimonas sp. OK307]